MSIEENKATVERFNSYYGTLDFDGMADLLSDDCAWRFMGSSPLLPEGALTKNQYLDFLRGMSALLDGGMTMTVIGTVGEGDRVAAEIRSHAVTKDGKTYNNEYHILYVIRDGLIVEVHEYLDITAAAGVFQLS